MRKIALNLLFNWLPSATATFVGGLALHLYLQPPAAPPAGAKTEIVPTAAAAMAVAPSIAVARPNDAVPDAAPDLLRPSAPAAAKASTVQPKAKPAPPRAPAATATRNHPPAAVTPDPAPRENPKAAVAAPRLPAPETAAAPPLPPPETIVASAPREAAPAAEEPPPQGPVAPQPFSMSELKQRLAGATAETSPSEPTCDNRFGPLTAKPCATKPWP